MTPIEVLEAWKEGKKLEYIGDTVTGVQFRIFTKKGSHDHDAKAQNIGGVTILHETFGFDEARKRLEAGKIIGERDYIYRINNTNHTLEYRTQSIAWLPFSGYPLDWPDSQDFYEVE